MKKCFKCNQVVDNYQSVCPSCGNNYFIPEKTNQLNYNFVMQQYATQQVNQEAGFGYYVLEFVLGIFLNMLIFAPILLLTSGDVRRKLRDGAIIGILTTFILTIILVNLMH